MSLINISNHKMDISGMYANFMRGNSKKKRKTPIIEELDEQSYEQGLSDEESPLSNKRHRSESSSTIIVRNNDMFDPDGLTLDDSLMTAVSNIASEASEIVPDQPCMLPEDETEQEREQREYDEEGIGGEGYECELCRIGCDDPEFVAQSPGLKKIYEYERGSFMHVSIDQLCTGIATIYNATIYRRAVALGNKKKLAPLTKAKVRYHKKNHDQKFFKWNLKEQIVFQTRMLDFLRRNGIFQKREESVRMNERELAKYLKLIKEMRETVKMVHGIDKSECTASITATIKTGPSKTFPEY